jgi:high-affinity nickel-transport protein
VDAVTSAVLLGFVLGLQHATDPDHLVAVATIATREQRLLGGLRVGLLWGVGHTTTLAVAGTIVVGLGRNVPVPVATGLEFLVAALLVVLGVARLRDAARGILAVAPERRLGDHTHAPEARAGIVHTHHGEPHVHPSPALLAAWRDEPRRSGLRALAVGAVHGMAGTATVALLVLATLPTVSAAIFSLLVFGLGTLAGMTALTGVMAYPIARLARVQAMRRAMAVASGVASIAFGCWYAARLV